MGQVDRASVRRLEPGDWSVYRGLRLRALADAPDAFMRTLAEDEGTDAAEWGRRLAEGADASRSLPLVAECDGEPAGLAWGRADPTDAELAHLFQMWVAPGHRGRGVGRALVAAVVAWAAEAGFRTLALDVTLGDTPATRLYRSAGFEPWGEPQPLRPGSDLRAQPMRRSLAPRDLA